MLAQTKIESSERQLCLKIVRRIRLVLKALGSRADDTETTSHPEVSLKWSGFSRTASPVFKMFVAFLFVSRSMTWFSFSAALHCDICYSTLDVKYLACVSSFPAPTDSDEKIKSSGFTSLKPAHVDQYVHHQVRFNWNKQVTTG